MTSISPEKLAGIDLNVPYSQLNGQKTVTPSAEAKTTEPETKEEVVEKKEVVADTSDDAKDKEPEAEAEEPRRVPYSRLKNVWNAKQEAEQRAAKAEREAQEWRQKAEQRPVQSNSDSASGQLPAWWVKLYGDSDASQEAWKVQDAANKDFREQVTKEARQNAD